MTPVDSAALSGALNIVVQDVCPGSLVAHGDLPRHPVVLAARDTVLGAEAQQVPSDVACGCLQSSMSLVPKLAQAARVKTVR